MFINPCRQNWLQAKGNCTESGMQLASITSIAQKGLLDRAYNNVTFHGGKLNVSRTVMCLHCWFDQ